MYLLTQQINKIALNDNRTNDYHYRNAGRSPYLSIDFRL